MEISGPVRNSSMREVPRAETAIDENFAEKGIGGLRILANGDAFACRQAVEFEHGGIRADRGFGFPEGGRALVGGGGNAVPQHKLLGEILARFQLSGFLGWSPTRLHRFSEQAAESPSSLMR